MGQNLPDIPGYEVESEVGRGGMGVVFKARKLDTGAALALKMILCNRDATFQELARFRIEAEAMACLDHPNIVKIRDVGVFSGYPFLALDYAEGGSLKHATKGRPQPTRWSAGLVATLADAMQHAHGRGMLHRDLKPANVLIAGDGTPRISDFGLVKFSAPMSKVSEACCTFSVEILDMELGRFSREFSAPSRPHAAGATTCEDDEIRNLVDAYATTATLPSGGLLHSVKGFLEETRRQARVAPSLDGVTLAGTIMGSPSYMAPEQARGALDEIGPGTDIYALGGILHALLTGSPPITGNGYASILGKIMGEGVPPIRQLDPGLPRELEAICLRCLDRNIKRRYPRASDLAADLRRFLDKSPTDSPAARAGNPIEAAETTITDVRAAPVATTRRWWPFGRG